jgi:hypothetical protein
MKIISAFLIALAVLAAPASAFAHRNDYSSQNSYYDGYDSHEYEYQSYSYPYPSYSYTNPTNPWYFATTPNYSNYSYYGGYGANAFYNTPLYGNGYTGVVDNLRYTPPINPLTYSPYVY